MERLVADAVAEHPRAVAAAPPLRRPAGRGPRRASRARAGRRRAWRACPRTDGCGCRSRPGRTVAPASVDQLRARADRCRGPRRRRRPRRSRRRARRSPSRPGASASSVRTRAPMIAPSAAGMAETVSSVGHGLVLALRPRRRAGPAAARRLALGRRLHRRRRLHRPLDRVRAARAPTPRSTSSCSRRRRPASARPAGTAAGSSARCRGAREHWAERGGRAGAIAQARAIAETVDEVGRVVAAEGIDCDFVKGGSLHVAQTPLELERVVAEVEESRAWEGDDELLDAAATAARVGVAGALGASFTPHCARVQPAKLARGLAHAAERAGRGHLRGDARDADRARPRRHAVRDRPRAARRARDRGLHGGAARAAARCCSRSPAR